VESQHGLLTTVAYKMGDKPAVFALEGSIASAGSAIDWLVEGLGIVESVSEIEQLASSVPDSGDVYFVTAFGGLLAPRWRPDARGTIVGLTQFTRRTHLVRATLESICFQVRDVLDAMKVDSGLHFSQILVDGGMSHNDTLMQLQADLLGLPVSRHSMAETTALGAAMAAGQAKGIEVLDMEHQSRPTIDTFQPLLDPDVRDVRFERWRLAVTKSLDWHRTKEQSDVTEEKHRLISSVPGSIFVFTSIALHFLAQKLAIL